MSRLPYHRAVAVRTNYRMLVADCRHVLAQRAIDPEQRLGIQEARRTYTHILACLELHICRLRLAGHPKHADDGRS